MPTTLEQLQTSLTTLQDVKQKVINDMSDMCDLSLLDDNNDATFTHYIKVLIHVSNSIDSASKAMEHIEKTVSDDKTSGEKKTLKIIFE